jgi:ATP-dependent RNA helicase RhlE
MSFDSLGLGPEILKAVAEAGYTIPTPIQSQAIPAILAGRDIMGGAQTGTGKTAGFVLPMLQLFAHYANASPSPARHPVRALILTPTRELAMQVEESVRTYAKHSGLRSTVVYGGVNIDNQIPILRAGVEILVATPGRLLDHLHQKTVNLGQVEIFVLDEADRMLDMGFIPDIKRIMAVLPARRQNLLFSATFSDEIKKLADQLLNAPQLIEVAKRNTAAENVGQSAYKVSSDQKRALLAHLVRSCDLKQVLVFVRTKHGAGRLARQLEKEGINATAIHGDKTQGARVEALEGFKAGEVRVLVATDVAARGLDIEELPTVINYELPYVAEDYIHRIGRTGRAGLSGDAISLCAPDEEKLLVEIEKLLKRKIEIKTAEGFDPFESRHREFGKPAPRARAEARSGPRSEPRTRPEAGPRAASLEPRHDRRDPSAYDLNPDQPLPARRENQSPEAGPAFYGHGVRQREIPALLRKPTPKAEIEG